MFSPWRTGKDSASPAVRSLWGVDTQRGQEAMWEVDPPGGKSTLLREDLKKHEDHCGKPKTLQGPTPWPRVKSPQWERNSGLDMLQETLWPWDMVLWGDAPPTVWDTYIPWESLCKFRFWFSRSEEGPETLHVSQAPVMPMLLLWDLTVTSTSVRNVYWHGEVSRLCGQVKGSSVWDEPHFILFEDCLTQTHKCTNSVFL